MRLQETRHCQERGGILQLSLDLDAMRYSSWENPRTSLAPTTSMNDSPFSLTVDSRMLYYLTKNHLFVVCQCVSLGTRHKTHVNTCKIRSSILLSYVSRLLAGPKALLTEGQRPLSIWNSPRVYAWRCVDVRTELLVCVRPYKDISKSVAQECCSKSRTFPGVCLVSLTLKIPRNF